MILILVNALDLKRWELLEENYIYYYLYFTVCT